MPWQISFGYNDSGIKYINRSKLAEYVQIQLVSGNCILTTASNNYILDAKQGHFSDIILLQPNAYFSLRLPPGSYAGAGNYQILQQVSVQTTEAH